MFSKFLLLSAYHTKTICEKYGAFGKNAVDFWTFFGQDAHLSLYARNARFSGDIHDRRSNKHSDFSSRNNICCRLHRKSKALASLGLEFEIQVYLTEKYDVLFAYFYIQIFTKYIDIKQKRVHNLIGGAVFTQEHFGFIP